MLAWVLRFGFFGLGGPAFPGVTLLILSCIVYGMAFDFFNVPADYSSMRNATKSYRHQHKDCSC